MWKEKLITIYDLNRNPTAVLENAFNVGYDKQTNKLQKANFNLLKNDLKSDKVLPMHYAEIIADSEDGQADEYIGLYRILPSKHSFSSTTNQLRFDLEHVLGTLFGTTLFKYHQYTNFTTRQVLESLLNKQKTKHWVLGDCEFTRYFHYSWENENLLSAIFSVPKSFDEQYVWECDTTVYPWVLHLRKAKTEVSTRVVQGYNLKNFTMESDPMNLYNRVYPLGAGEGVNQLDIRKVNNGIPYVENAVSIAKYGLYEYTWADRRFTDAESLKASAIGLLQKWSEPIISWDTTVADLSQLTGIQADKIREGKICRIMLDDYPDPIDLRVVSESKSDIYGDYTNMDVSLGSVKEDLGTTETDLKRKQQINELYSQGATNILNFGYQDNCDGNIPALIPFYIDDDVVNVNTIELTFRTKRYRAYSGVTKGGGALVKSTSSGGGTIRSTTSGGGTTATSSSGGGVSKSTESGGSTTQTSTVNGQSTQTSSANGSHRHVMFQTTGSSSLGETGVNATAAGGVVFQLGTNTPAMANIETLSAADNHTHSVTTPAHSHSVAIPAHSHEFNTPNHTHSVTIPNHSHDVTVPDHTHEIQIPDHTHEIVHEIVEAPVSAGSVVIKVDGNIIPHTSTSGDRIDLTDYLSKDDSGRITRGRHEITITPNTIARIEADLILRVFIQSQLGGNL